MAGRPLVEGLGPGLPVTEIGNTEQEAQIGEGRAYDDPAVNHGLSNPLFLQRMPRCLAEIHGWSKSLQAEMHWGESPQTHLVLCGRFFADVVARTHMRCVNYNP